MQRVWQESSAAEFRRQSHNNSPVRGLAGVDWHFCVSVNTARLRQQWQVGRRRAALSLC